MKANELCPAPHLEAADLGDSDVVVTIKDIGFAIVGSEQVRKGILQFEEMPRGMVLNRTNLKRVVAMYGSETDEWKGKKLALYASETDFAGKTVPCIRIREKVPK
jgi:hypothetical protein